MFFINSLITTRNGEWKGNVFNRVCLFIEACDHYLDLFKLFHLDLSTQGPLNRH